MPVPIICLDDEVCQFAERFREQFSKPQYQYFVTVRLRPMVCEGRRTLSGLVRTVGEHGSLAGLSRFLSEAPWSQEELAASWLTHFRQEMQFVVEAERHRQQSQQPKRRGRPKQPLVTGYVIGDDSTMRHPRKAGRWQDWAHTTRPPRRNESWAIAWCRDSTFCSRDGVRWLRTCIDRKRSAKQKKWLSRARLPRWKRSVIYPKKLAVSQKTCHAAKRFQRMGFLS